MPACPPDRIPLTLRVPVPKPSPRAQTAAQSVGFGLKFSAEATLDIEEHPKGIPPEAGPGESAYASNGNGDGSARRREMKPLLNDDTTFLQPRARSVPPPHLARALTVPHSPAHSRPILLLRAMHTAQARLAEDHPPPRRPSYGGRPGHLLHAR